MTQTRTVHQAKIAGPELRTLFRTKAIEALVADQVITQEEAAALADTNLNWRGTLDGGIAITLDPVWPPEMPS